MPRVHRTMASSDAFHVDIDPYDREAMCALVVHAAACPCEGDKSREAQRMEVHDDRVPPKAMKDADGVELVERGYDVRVARCIDCGQQVVVDLRGS